MYVCVWGGVCVGERGTDLDEIWAGVKKSFPKITSEAATDGGVKIPVGQIHYHTDGSWNEDSLLTNYP